MEEDKPAPTQETEPVSKPEASEPASSEPERTKEKKPRKPRAKKGDGEEKTPKKKPLSKLARKRQDERYYLNGKGRLVSKKKSENGKKNVQSRAMRLSRKLLGLNGRMVLIGKGDEGKALLELTASIRDTLKQGKSDEEAEALHVKIADKLLKK